MNIPNDLLYTKDHEWIRIVDDFATIGVTDYAQGELGDIVFIEFPEVGDILTVGDVFGTVEAVKTVADLFAPISGEIIEINENLVDSPELINTDPYREGWIVTINSDKKINISDYLNADEYLLHIGH